jgi:hypothetical protein
MNLAPNGMRNSLAPTGEVSRYLKDKIMLQLSDILGEFDSIVADIAKLRGYMAQAEQSLAADATSRRYLAELGKTIDESVNELKDKLPQNVAYLQKTDAENKASVEKSMAAAAELQRKSEELVEKAEREAAAPAPPAKPAVTHLGDAEIDVTIRNYREELLRLLDKPTDGAGPAIDDREIWQDWSRIEEE